MRRAPKSIKGRIFLWLFTFTSLLLIAAGLFLYHEVREIVMGAMDRTLHSKVQVITGLLHEEHDSIELELSEVILGEYSIPRSGHYYKVVMDGKLLAASPSLVDGSFDLAAGLLQSTDGRLREKIYESRGPDGEPVRVLQHDLDAFGRTFSVLVAESLSESIGMIHTFRNFLFVVIFSGILGVCLIGLWTARRSLDPLKDFSARIRTITHKTLGERLNAEAETRELTGLASSFNEMLGRLERAFESEKRLVADASHELKTPLSVIRAQCDVTLQKKRRAEEYIAAIETIRSVSETIETMVRDMLSLARLDSGILTSKDFTVVSLNECVQRALAMVHPLAEKRRVRIVSNLEAAVEIAGNRDSLTEAFLNVIENGVKYNRENGLLEVSAARDGAKAVVEIRDTGVGIQDGEVERIFDRFYRADTPRSGECTGLGLSIAKTIIEAHGGEITVKSEPGKGSTFMIALPAGPSW